MLPNREKTMFYLSLVLLIFVVIGLSVMGIRTILDTGRFDFFNQIGLPRVTVLVWAVYTVVGALLMAHPRTFVAGRDNGNLNAAGIEAGRKGCIDDFF
jgi:hypothetical protein